MLSPVWGPVDNKIHQVHRPGLEQEEAKGSCQKHRAASHHSDLPRTVIRGEAWFWPLTNTATVGGFIAALSYCPLAHEHMHARTHAHTTHNASLGLESSEVEILGLNLRPMSLTPNPCID